MNPITSPSKSLVLRGISKRYPGTTALNAVDFEIGEGQVVALLGENGAGKSTLASIIGGVVRPSGGTMTWQGDTYAPDRPADAIANGIGLIHQEMRLLPDLTVAENVLVGHLPTKRGFLDSAKMRARAEHELRSLGFKASMDILVRDLSVAGQQQVEIAKALTLQSSLLILDEPTAALGEAETEALFKCISRLKERGVAFVYVSHRLAEISRVADKIIVLRDGAKVAEHESGEIPPEQLVREMVGRSVDRLFPDVPEPRDEVVLSVRGLSDRRDRFRKVTFEVRAGEIFGIAGIVGAGRTELVRAVASAEPGRGGTVTVDGTEVRADHPRSARDAGIVLIPEDRKQQGVIVSETIENNVALPNMAEVTRRGWIRQVDVRRFASRVSKRFGVKGNAGDPVASLSGGNQQKVVLAKWLAQDPRVVLLDEPTRGIDVGARAAIYEIIAELAKSGKAIVMVSSDLDEVLGMSHRVMVLAQGDVRGVLERSEATPQNVMHYAAG